MTPEELQAAAQGAARAYKARFADAGAEWGDLVQEAALALLVHKQRVAEADDPQAMAFVIAFRAIRTSRESQRRPAIKLPMLKDTSSTPEQRVAARQILRVIQNLKTWRHEEAKAVLAGETPAIVARRAGVSIGVLHDAVWTLRVAANRDPRVQEWRL